MNSFGRLFRTTIFGESHGECVGVVIDGVPPGLSLSEDDMLPDLARRKGGARGTTPRQEEDRPLIKSGLFEGRTTGAPILILFENKDRDSTAYDALRYTPRPGHSDFVAHSKYHGFNDYRGGGHFSGRLTAGVVAAGAIAKKLIAPLKVEAKIDEVGGSQNIGETVDAAIQDKDSVGGIVSCRATDVPVGLGEPFFDSAESLISHAVFSIPAVKGIEFGAGFAAAAMRGSAYNDAIIDISGKTKTNNAGGINGGITNGNDVFFRVLVRPTASIPRPQQTIDLRTGAPTEVLVTGRHDACIALRMPVIIEAVTAMVFADLMLIDKACGK